MPEKKTGDPLIVDVQGIGPVAFPAGTSGAQIEAWVMGKLREAGVPPQTWGQYLGNMALRVGGGIAGGVVGSLAGPVGTFAGTATGAALGDELAQRREVAQGQRQAVNPIEMLAAGATAPIPGATMKAGPLLRQVPRAFAANMPAAAATSVATQAAQTGRVDPYQVGTDTLRGSALGSLMGLGAHGAIRGAQSPAAQKLMRDESGNIRVYHGSPHDFDQFSMEKIGTGEGAQAYGHGLYFAENENVAAEYRKALSERIDAFDPDRGYGVKEPKTGEIKWFANEKDAKEYAIDTGKTYEVNIKADPEHFLDWDKPLSEQSPKARVMLIEAMKRRGLPLDEHGVPLWVQRDPSGEAMYSALASSGASDREGQAAASKLLREAGVPGVRYLDQGSRPDMGRVRQLRAEAERYTAAGEHEYAAEALKLAKAIEGSGTRNYAVFDDKLIDIMRKYGILPFVGGAAAVNQAGRQKDEKR